MYKGWAYFKYNDNISRYKDSAMVSATVTSNDSLMVIKNLPLRIITNRLDRSYAQHLDSTAVIPDIEATVRIYLPAATRPTAPTCMSTGSGSCPAARTTR